MSNIKSRLAGLKQGSEKREKINTLLSSPIDKILVVRNDNIGDVVCTAPCFEALRQHFPEAFIGVLVCRLTEEVVHGNPFLDRVYVYDKAKHGRYRFVLTAWWKQFQVLLQIRDERFDLAIGVRSEFSPSQGWLVYASGAPFRVGIRPDGKHRRFSFFYNVYVEPLKEAVHEVERSLHILRRIGVDIEEKRLFLRLLTKNRNKAKEFFSRHGLRGDKPVICINFSRRMEENRYWKVENYVGLIRKLKKLNIQTIVTSVPKDAALVQQMLATLRFQIPSYYSDSLKDFAAVINLCDVFVTLQGGAMHIAAAVGTPTVALFGKNNPKIWAPWGEGHMILRRGNDANLIEIEEVFVTVTELLDLNRNKAGKRLKGNVK